MPKDKAESFLVARVGAVVTVDCRDEPNRPTFYGYNDAVQRLLSLRRQFPTSLWAVMPVHCHWDGEILS